MKKEGTKLSPPLRLGGDFMPDGDEHLACRGHHYDVGAESPQFSRNQCDFGKILALSLDLNESSQH